MKITQSFLQSLPKPGRYLGGEDGVNVPAAGITDAVVWFFPGPYERAMADSGWRRGFFGLVAQENITCLRAVDFAAEVWTRFEEAGVPPFTIDGGVPIADARAVVFWAPDVFAAARVPSILRRLNLNATGTTVGVVMGGNWAPRFLESHVDWVVPADRGWLPRVVLDLLAGDSTPPPQSCYRRRADNWDDLWAGSHTAFPCLDTGVGAHTPQWVPRVDTGSALVDVSLLAPGADGSLRRRPVAALVADALAGLRSTGADLLRFLDHDLPAAGAIAGAMMELTRVFNMKRVHVRIPPLGTRDYEQYWRAYKPHLVKPHLRIRVRATDDTAALGAIAADAFNDGWHTLTAVLTFASFDEFTDILTVAGEVMGVWSRAAATFEDRRPLHIEYDPAPIDRWQGAPSEPSEDQYRRLTHECRRFRESLPSAIGTTRSNIERTIARNWLAAADRSIWNRLAALDLTEPSDAPSPPFDWCLWIRTQAGLTEPPRAPFALRAPGDDDPAAEDVPAGVPTPASVAEIAGAQTQIYGRRRRKPALTRRLGAPDRTRLRVCWGKTPEWRLYSHLDSVRAIERTIRRSGLPAAYSEGFHPHLKLSFGPPLPFGLTSSAEMFDLLLDRSVEPADITALQRVLPRGLFISKAEGVPAQMPSLSESINEAVYSTVVPLDAGEAQSRIDAMMARPDISWTRTDRPHRPPRDPRGTLRDVRLEETSEGTRWTISLILGREGGIRPDDWAQLALGLTPEQVKELTIERTALLIRRGSGVKTPFDFP